MFVKQIFLWILLVVVLAFTLRVVYELFSFVFRKDKSAMYVPSFDRHIRLMKQLKLTRGKKLVDLWCGDGKAMRFFTQQFGLQCDGYELLSFPYCYGKLLNLFLWYPQIHLYKQNFLQADLKRYDYVYVYLLPNQMADIESRIFQNIKFDAIIISNSFQFAVHKPYKVITNKKGKPSIFLYKKKSV